jgi:hypothetical protein
MSGNFAAKTDLLSAVRKKMMQSYSALPRLTRGAVVLLDILADFFYDAPCLNERTHLTFIKP